MRIAARRYSLIQFASAIVALAGLALLVSLSHSRKGATPVAPNQTSSSRSPRVISLVPAASDIIEGIGCGDHLVAVSNYDLDPRTRNLPRVGDYLTTDWERIAPLRPQVIVTQYAEGRTPAGFAQRVQALGAKQVNLHIDRLEDIYVAAQKLGDACDEHEKGAKAVTALRQKLDAIHQRVANEPVIPALIVVNSDGTGVAGPGTYLDDLLTIAGGKNAAAELDSPWPTIDRERLAALAPQAIIQLLASDAPQVQRQAESVWASMPDVPAVKNGRVVRLSQWYVMQPGYEVATLAQQFAQTLHPQAMSQPVTTSHSTMPMPN